MSEKGTDTLPQCFQAKLNLRLFIHPFPIIWRAALPTATAGDLCISSGSSFAQSYYTLPCIGSGTADHKTRSSAFLWCYPTITFPGIASGGGSQPLPYFQWLLSARGSRLGVIPGKCAGRLGFFWPQALLPSLILD